MSRTKMRVAWALAGLLALAGIGRRGPRSRPGRDGVGRPDPARPRRREGRQARGRAPPLPRRARVRAGLPPRVGRAGRPRRRRPRPEGALGAAGGLRGHRREGQAFEVPVRAALLERRRRGPARPRGPARGARAGDRRGRRQAAGRGEHRRPALAAARRCRDRVRRGDPGGAGRRRCRQGVRAVPARHVPGARGARGGPRAGQGGRRARAGPRGGAAARGALGPATRRAGAQGAGRRGLRGPPRRRRAARRAPGQGPGTPPLRGAREARGVPREAGLRGRARDVGEPDRRDEPREALPHRVRLRPRDHRRGRRPDRSLPRPHGRLVRQGPVQGPPRAWSGCVLRTPSSSARGSRSGGPSGSRRATC